MKITHDKLASDRKQLQEIINQEERVGNALERLFTTCASDFPAFDILSPIHSICYFMHGFLFLWGLFYSFCTNVNDSHLLHYLIYSLMSSARDCSAHAILVSGGIGKAASQAGEQGQLGEANLFPESYSVVCFFLPKQCV